MLTHYDKNKIDELNKEFRIQLINSLPGFKSACLIGSKNQDGIENLGMFSTVIHLGSFPSLLGFIHRPVSTHSHTYKNIKANGYYTINQVKIDMIDQAHFASGKFDEMDSEFIKCSLTSEYVDGFSAPFVLECDVKIGLKLVEEVHIKTNNTILMVGEVEHILVEDYLVSDHGEINLVASKTSAIGAVSSYHKAEFINRIGQVILPE
jgi:flavin reductase (DIM6/NTAB) family NADH-FMN oxidoreductase RutF